MSYKNRETAEIISDEQWDNLDEASQELYDYMEDDEVEDDDEEVKS